MYAYSIVNEACSAMLLNPTAQPEGGGKKAQSEEEGGAADSILSCWHCLFLLVGFCMPYRNVCVDVGCFAHDNTYFNSDRPLQQPPSVYTLLSVSFRTASGQTYGSLCTYIYVHPFIHPCLGCNVVHMTWACRRINMHMHRNIYAHTQIGRADRQTDRQVER